MIATIEEDNLKRNNVSVEEIKAVFASDLSYAEDLEPSLHGNDRVMVIGWTYSGRILEVGVEFFHEEDRKQVFHAMDAGRQFRKNFTKRLGQ